MTTTPIEKSEILFNIILFLSASGGSSREIPVNNSCLSKFVHNSLKEPCHEKTSFCHMQKHKGADQPVHPRSLISAIVVRNLNSIIPIIAKSKLSTLQLVSEV